MKSDSQLAWVLDSEARGCANLDVVADQRVRRTTISSQIELRRGEQIHTESSVKYDEKMVDTLFAGAGFTRERTFFDREHRFAVHLARTG